MGLRIAENEIRELPPAALESSQEQAARQLATLDEMLGGRLTVNIISSDMPGAPLESEPRYRRTLEVMKLLRQWMGGEAGRFEGEFFSLDLEPPSISARRRRCPPFYFGGLSEAARAVAASTLVKSAVHGGDPNWGRIIDAIGYSPAKVIEEKVDIAYSAPGAKQLVYSLKKGRPTRTSFESLCKAVEPAEFDLHINLNLGRAKAIL